LPKKKAEESMPKLPLGTVIPCDLKEISASPSLARTVQDEEALVQLVGSIERDGLLLPPRARRVDGHLELIAGHRRVEAARRLGWVTIPVEVVECDDAEAARAGLSENLQRASLHPLDEGRQFKAVMEELDWTLNQLAQAIGRSRSYVQERLSLLALPEKLQEAMQERVVTPAQARALAPLEQLGVLEDGIDGVRKKPDATEERVEQTVGGIFQARTISLDRETPFDWKEECAAKGCLGTAPDGKPVCTNPANYVASVAAVHREEMESDLKAFLGGKGKDAEGLPVYYDLSPLVPVYGMSAGDGVYGMSAGDVDGMPALPVSFSDSIYSKRAEAAPLAFVLPHVADKDGCRACPAWGGKGAGRALLVCPPSRSMYGGPRDRVRVLCMNLACRKKKMEEGKSAKEVRDQEKERRVEAAQDGLKERALAAARLLAANPTKVLAAGLIRRDGLKQDARLEYEIAEVLEFLGVNLPPFGGQPDAVLRALEALGEETLLLVHSVRLVRSLDRAYEDYQTRWLPNRLEATLALLLGDRVEEKSEVKRE